jgi:hypothetical protein
MAHDLNQETLAFPSFSSRVRGYTITDEDQL